MKAYDILDKIKVLDKIKNEKFCISLERLNGTTLAFGPTDTSALLVEFDQHKNPHIFRKLSSPMNVLGLLKPEYFLRPQQIPLRFWRGLRARSDTIKTVRLPWGSDLRVNVSDSMGWSIYTRSIYETAATETLWRLTYPGDHVADVGANIGYMASLLTARVGRSGRVLCFEPHPKIAAELRRNVALWPDGQSCCVWQAAVGESSGSGSLFVPDEYFSHNNGISSLSPRSESGKHTEIPVQIVSLDDVVPTSVSLSVVKIDVEGHELSVLKGMHNILESRRVRYIVFEEFASFPAPTHAFLADRGYTTYGIECEVKGIRFTPSSRATGNDIPVYLATLERPEVLNRIQKAFWQSFGPYQLLINLTRNRHIKRGGNQSRENNQTGSPN